MRECCRQIQAGGLRKGSNKVHQTWQWPSSRALYSLSVISACLLGLCSVIPPPQPATTASGIEPLVCSIESRDGIHRRDQESLWLWQYPSPRPTCACLLTRTMVDKGLVENMMVSYLLHTDIHTENRHYYDPECWNHHSQPCPI